MDKTLLAVVGPTAIGKTALAISLAKHFQTEIISTDSRQFYKEMTIGTAVPSPDELAEVQHHFIQHLSVLEPWTVGDFETAALKRLALLFKTNNIVIASGGSGLYIQALTEGLDHFPETDPEIRARLNTAFAQHGITYLQERLLELDRDYYHQVDQHNPHRLIRAIEVSESSGRPYSSFLNKPKKKRPFKVVYMGLTADRELIYQRIEDRVDLMMKTGLLEEVQSLLEYKELIPLQTVGYQELFEYLAGNCDLESAIEEIKKNTRRFAKRQLTWFRKNQAIHWVNYNKTHQEVLEIAESLLT